MIPGTNSIMSPVEMYGVVIWWPPEWGEERRESWRRGKKWRD